VSAADILRCPRTGRALAPEGAALHTPEGSQRYPVQHGVPNFRAHDPADLDDERALAAMAEAARRDGWRAALRAHRPELLAYVDDPGRARFLDLLPLTPETVALEIGPGLGQFLVPLGRRVARVHGLELSPGQALFAAARCREEGVDNAVVAAGGDDLLLPYADASIDVVILNNVLEWVRPAGASIVTEDAQRLLLGEVQRVLRPGGAFFVATKNRYALRHLLGGRDENARDVRFGHALPRRLARALAARRPRILGLLHSRRGLAALLRSAGFEPGTGYWAGPDPRYPQWIVEASAASIRAARRRDGFVQGATRSTAALMPLVPAALVKHLAPGLAFVARKPVR
jgi:SAM-dependent methyltransferase